MPWRIGDTVFIRTGKKKHLFVVVTEAKGSSSEHMLVSFTTVYSSNKTCIVRAHEHPALTQECHIHYAEPMRATAEQLGAAARSWDRRARCSRALLGRIVAGIEQSQQTPFEFLDFYCAKD